MARSAERRRVVVIDGCRTPFLKARGKPGPFSAVDLAAAAGRTLRLRRPEMMAAVQEVILGCGAPTSEAPNTARVAALRMGMGEKVPAFSVQRNCGSGMQAIDTAYKYIAAGEADILLAGGVDALSHAPLELPEETVRWLAKLSTAKSPQAKLAAVAEFRPRMARPEVSLMKGLTDDVVKLNMGQTAEVLAHEWRIRRHAADRYAMESHQRLARAQREGWLEDEVVPVFSADGEMFDRDDGVRPDTDMDALSDLEPNFEPPYGQVTPGNSSQVTDGACWTLLASEAAAERFGAEPLGEIIDSEWAALDPARMGLGPVLSVTPMLKRHDLAFADVDLWELNEAFAAQVLACLAAWSDADFCRDRLGLEAPPGPIARDRLNIDGGAIALGHPVGASGARIVLHALNALQREGGSRAVATECIGGGQGGAMLVQRL
ncbi:acetyl-CoA C-acetyltransferase [Glycocaulis profundi]|nr:acetyl-CoA C-acetyltransferase [Glycocaulis profundi]